VDATSRQRSEARCRQEGGVPHTVFNLVRQSVCLVTKIGHCQWWTSVLPFCLSRLFLLASKKQAWE
jgi:hypothetical protein